MTYFKDVVFAITLCYFYAGCMTSGSSKSKEQLVALIIILSFTAVAVLLTLIKYGKSALGMEKDEGMEEILNMREHHKKSSWFNITQTSN